MFCIKRDVITLGSIEMCGFITVWTSMDDGFYWVILPMYGSHDIRHTGFRRLTMVNKTPGFWGVTNITPILKCCFVFGMLLQLMNSNLITSLTGLGIHGSP